MSVESTALPLKQSKDYRGIIWGGLAAGVMDISAAIISTAIQAGRGPVRVLQTIASGILGANSYKGGVASAALGLLIHFFIAFSICTVYFVASRKLTFLIRYWLVCGLLYGMAAYFVMYGIVLRLTFHRNFLTVSGALLQGVLVHMFCVGLPIAFCVQRFSKPSSAD